MWEISDSHYNNYIESCKLFCSDEEKFKEFKQDSSYTTILEHLSINDAHYFLSKINNSFKKNKHLIEKFKENDIYGSPSIHNFEYFGLISPSTIRYIKCVSDISNFLNDIELKNIVEIGGGYGGLAKTISCVYNYDSYVLADQKYVNMLSEKYLNLFPELSKKINHINSHSISNVYNVDLTISNYAISELSIDMQNEYYEKILKNSKYIYITYNTSHYEKFLEIISNDFSYEVEEELFQNKIIYGKNINVINE